MEAASATIPGEMAYVKGPEVLKWDAAYTAAGVAAGSLDGKLDFKDWFGKR